MADPNLIIAALAIKATNPKRLFKVEWEGKLYWLKQPDGTAKKSYAWRSKAQDFAAELFKMNLLRPTARPGSLKDLKIEQRRIDDWRRLGLPAPEIVASGDDWFLMKDCGVILPKVLPALDQDSQKELLGRALDVLLNAHRKGQHHGRPMIKDMTVSGGTITLLDFEETPLDVMSLPEAQARDLLIFLSSVPADKALLESLIRQITPGADPETMAVLRRAVHYFRPVRKLGSLLVHGRSRKARKIAEAFTLGELLEKALS